MPKKIVVNNGGQFEDTTSTVLGGVANAAKIVELDAAGLLANTMINGAVASAGAPDAGKPVVLDASGRVSPTVLPVGIGADTQFLPASETLSAGDYVNISDVAGTATMRKADASTTGKEAMGFVLAGVAGGTSGTVYFEGSNTAATVKTAGQIWLDPANPGKGTLTVPITAGQIQQLIGFGTGNSVNLQITRSLKLN